MSSTPDFIEYIAAQISDAGAITYRKMFGEYALYCDAKVVALVCDDQLFIMGDTIHFVQLWKKGVIQVLKKEGRKSSGKTGRFSDFMRGLPYENKMPARKEPLVIQS